MSSANPVFLDGRWGTTDDMKVSVLDRGYLFGDGVYEVYRLYGGKAFTRELHLERLQNSLAGIELFLPYGRDEFEAILDQVEERCPPDSYVYIHVTRGIAPRRHSLPEDPRPSVMVMPVPLAPIPAKLFTEGICLLSQTDERWLRCRVKSLNLLANCLGMTAANRAGCFEALFVGGDGLVNESAASSFFCVVDGVLRTAPLTRNILPGVTRRILLGLVRENGIAYREEAVSLEQACGAAEAFISNSVFEILPVVRIDERRIGEGGPGPVTAQLARLFAARVKEETGAEAGCKALFV